MGKKKSYELLLVCTFITILAALSVHALPLNDSITAHYSLDVNLTVQDNITGKNLSKTGSPINVPGVLGNAFKFSSGNYLIQGSSLPALPNGNTSFTWMLWFNKTQEPSSNLYGLVNWGSANTAQATYEGYGNQYNSHIGSGINMGLYGDGGDPYVQTNSSLATNTWYHLAVTYNASTKTYSLYVNGALNGTGTKTTNINLTASLIRIGATVDDGSQLTGELDEVSIFNRVVNAADINAIYKNESTGNPYPWTSQASNTAPAAPTFVNPTPSNNSAQAVNQMINMSCAATLNYYLYFANVTPPTTLVLTNSSTSNYTTNFTTLQKYYYMGACYNVTSNLLSLNTSIQQVTFDNVSPTITLQTGNSWNLTRTNNYNNLTVNQSFLDNRDLFAYELNVTKNNAQYYWENNLTLSGTLSYNLSKTINTSAFPLGIFTIMQWLSDTHTAAEIPAYTVTNLDPAVAELQTSPTISINIADQSGGTLTLNQQTDRYTFDINSSDLTQTGSGGVLIGGGGLDTPPPTPIMNFTVTSTKPIYIPVSDIPGHLVTWDESTHSGNWIDFNCGIMQDNGSLDTSVVENTSIVRINDTTVEIDVATAEPNLACQSIGGLNIVQQNFTWVNGAPTINTFYPGNNSYTSNTTGIYNINCTSSTQAQLFIDGVSEGLNSSYNENSLWQFTSNPSIGSGVHNFYFNCTVDGNTTTQSQTRTLTVYNLVQTNFSNPQNGSIISTAITNVSWDAIVFNPVINGAVNISQQNLSLYNNTGGLMYYINSNLSGGVTNYTWNLSKTNVTTGNYTLQMTAKEPQGTTITDSVNFSVSCVEDWSCTPYTNTYGNPLCPDVYMSRTCTDQRGCGTNTTIPSVYFCIASSGSATPAGGGSSPTTYSIANPETNITVNKTNQPTVVENKSNTNLLIITIAFMFFFIAIIGAIIIIKER